MSVISVVLAEEQLTDLQSNVYRCMKEEIERARYDCRVEVAYMNKKETCKYLNVSNNTLDKFIEAGLPRMELMGVVRFNKKKIDIWIAENFVK